MSETEKQDGTEQEKAGRAGGLARKAALTDEQRKEIASKAAQARWLVKAEFGAPDKPLRIGDIEIPCYVLEDGRRVLVQGGFLGALGRHPKANVRREGGEEEQIPAILQGKAIRPFISQEILEKSRPIRFQTPQGARASGYRADLLPDVCEVYLKARDADVLPPNQRHVAKQAEILMRALAHVGIIALVDEATGYQDVRQRDALQALLERYLRKEFAAWAKRFPDEFYKEIFRLRGWAWRGMQVNRPQAVAQYTKNIVWERLAPGILKELEARNPIVDGRRKAKHHQLLTVDVGHPALAQHLHAVMGLMRASHTWATFMRLLDAAFPRRGDTLQMPFMAEPPAGEEA